MYMCSNRIYDRKTIEMKLSLEIVSTYSAFSFVFFLLCLLSFLIPINFFLNPKFIGECSPRWSILANCSNKIKEIRKAS